MSFLTAVPEELIAAATQLEAIASSLTAQSTAAAAPTTSIAPAASDEVSALQAGIFTTYGTWYQQLAAEAQAIQEQFVSTLKLSSGTYASTESANAISAQTTGPIAQLINSISSALGGPLNSNGGNLFSLSSNGANFLSFESGNWASAMSDCLGMAGGGLLPAAAADTGDAGAALSGTTAPATGVGMGGMGGIGGMGAMPVAAGMGQATMVGKISVPPSWAGIGTPTGAAVTPITTVGYTGAAPGAAPGAIVPGMPGMGAARNSAGFGAPRYGVKPIVMPKVQAV
jgi:hypothetical protein